MKRVPAIDGVSPVIGIFPMFTTGLITFSVFSGSAFLLASSVPP